MIDVDTLIPKIDTNNFDFNGWISKLNAVDKQVKNNTLSWQDYSNKLKDNEKWIASWGAETQGQIRTQEGLIKANENARQAAIAHNNALKQQTLSAKAAELGLKALSIAGNILASVLISLIVTEVIKFFDNIIHKAEYAREALEETTSELEDLNSELETTKSRIEELEGKSSQAL